MAESFAAAVEFAPTLPGAVVPVTSGNKGMQLYAATPGLRDPDGTLAVRLCNFEFLRRRD